MTTRYRSTSDGCTYEVALTADRKGKKLTMRRLDGSQGPNEPYPVNPETLEKWVRVGLMVEKN